MRKPQINFAIDALAFFSFLGLVSTGFLIFLVLPPGSGHLSIWGMNRHTWGEIHFWIAVIFLSLMALHVVLHWDWIKNMVKGRSKNTGISKRRIVFAISLVLFVLFLLLAPFFSPIVNNAGQQSGHPVHVETAQ